MERKNKKQSIIKIRFTHQKFKELEKKSKEAGQTPQDYIYSKIQKLKEQAERNKAIEIINNNIPEILLKQSEINKKLFLRDKKICENIGKVIEDIIKEILESRKLIVKLSNNYCFNLDSVENALKSIAERVNENTECINGIVEIISKELSPKLRNQQTPSSAGGGLS